MLLNNIIIIKKIENIIEEIQYNKNTKLNAKNQRK